MPSPSTPEPRHAGEAPRAGGRTDQSFVVQQRVWISGDPVARPIPVLACSVHLVSSHFGKSRHRRGPSCGLAHCEGILEPCVRSWEVLPHSPTRHTGGDVSKDPRLVMGDEERAGVLFAVVKSPGAASSARRPRFQSGPVARTGSGGEPVTTADAGGLPTSSTLQPGPGTGGAYSVAVDASREAAGTSATSPTLVSTSDMQRLGPAASHRRNAERWISASPPAGAPPAAGKKRPSRFRLSACPALEHAGRPGGHRAEGNRPGWYRNPSPDSSTTTTYFRLHLLPAVTLTGTCQRFDNRVNVPTPWRNVDPRPVSSRDAAGGSCRCVGAARHMFRTRARHHPPPARAP